jgi:hypothetical protein
VPELRHDDQVSVQGEDTVSASADSVHVSDGPLPVLVRLRYGYRLYPDTAQCEALARSFGCAKVVFNDGLRLRQQAREAGKEYLSDGELPKRVITQAKDTPERAWPPAEGRKPAACSPGPPRPRTS